jgi:hypothetical protein
VIMYSWYPCPSVARSSKSLTIISGALYFPFFGAVQFSSIFHQFVHIWWNVKLPSAKTTACGASDHYIVTAKPLVPSGALAQLNCDGMEHPKPLNSCTFSRLSTYILLVKVNVFERK